MNSEAEPPAPALAPAAAESQGPTSYGDTGVSLFLRQAFSRAPATPTARPTAR